jgi:ADP-ribose pyrophosphatase YjhB (NUDIX family)
MPTLGVEIAILCSGQILLTQREDFETWCLPGGNVDAGESAAQAAVREAREETGLDVQLERLVGIYSMPRWGRGGAHVVVFAARPVGGSVQPQAGEVVAARYFEPDALPEPLLAWHGQRIRDALNGVGGSVAWSQAVVWPFEPDVTRPALYELRDRSGLSRQEFYLHHFGQAGRADETLEVGGKQGG